MSQRNQKARLLKMAQSLGAAGVEQGVDLLELINALALAYEEASGAQSATGKPGGQGKGSSPTHH